MMFCQNQIVSCNVNVTVTVLRQGLLNLAQDTVLCPAVIPPLSPLNYLETDFGLAGISVSLLSDLGANT